MGTRRLKPSAGVSCCFAVGRDSGAGDSELACATSSLAAAGCGAGVSGLTGTPEPVLAGKATVPTATDAWAGPAAAGAGS